MISNLHYITQDIEGLSHQELASKACEAGVDWVQLRIKNKPYAECLKIAMETKAICEKHKAKLIINDNVAIAKEINADGVHLGKSDMNPLDARKVLGENSIIGGTANTFEDIVKLSNEGADYVGLGPYRFTKTKENLSPVIGIEGYNKIMNQCKENNILTPIIAIGGINTKDVISIIDTGVDGIAISSAITLSTDIRSSVKAFKNMLN